MYCLKCVCTHLDIACLNNNVKKINITKLNLISVLKQSGLKYEHLCTLVCKGINLKCKINQVVSKPKSNKPYFLLWCYFKCFCANSNITFSNKTSIKEA